MSTVQKWIGLDVGELTANICVLGTDEHPELETTCGSSPSEIIQALSHIPRETIANVVLESGAEQGLARALRDIGLPVTLLDAAKAHRFLAIRSNKTDKNDARGLADIARLGRSDRLAVWVRSAEFENIRSELVMRDQIVRQRTAVRCCLRAQLRRRGSRMKCVAFGKAFRSKVESEFAAIGDGEVGFAAEMARLLEVSEALSRYIDDADKKLAGLANSNPVTRRFLDVPGVGPVCAVSFYSVIEDPYRFEDNSSVGAYLGMVPKFKQSGTAIHRASISRAGNTLTRSHLYLSAGVMLSRAAKQCAIGDWGKALAKRRGYKLARVAVARKMAIAMLSIWKRGCTFEAYPNTTSSRRREAGLVSVPIIRALSL